MRYFDGEETRLLHLFWPAASKRQIAADIASAVPDVYDPDMLAAMRGILEKLAAMTEDEFTEYFTSAAL